MDEEAGEIVDEDSDEMIRWIVAEALHHDPATCQHDECNVCGYMVCPDHYIEHFFHDGCPSKNCRGQQQPQTQEEEVVEEEEVEN
jgi:hypothetical protein